MPRKVDDATQHSCRVLDHDGGGEGGKERGEVEWALDREGSVGAGERGRLEFFLCDVGSTNGTYVQVGRGGGGLILSFLFCFIFSM